MISRNKLFPSLVCGFGVSVLITIPILKSIGCCLLIPLAGGIAVNLFYKTNNNEIDTSYQNAVVIGLFTGLFAALFAALFEVLITFILRTNETVEALPQVHLMLKEWKMDPFVDDIMKVFKGMANEIKTKGFSPLYTFYIVLSFVLVYPVFSLIGSLIGFSMLKRKSGL